MIRPEYLPPTRQRFFIEFQCFTVTAQLKIHISEVVHAGKRVGMIRPLLLDANLIGALHVRYHPGLVESAIGLRRRINRLGTARKAAGFLQDLRPYGWMRSGKERKCNDDCPPMAHQDCPW